MTYSVFQLPSAIFIRNSGMASFPLLASCLGKQAVPYVTQSISPLISIHDFRIHIPSLIHLTFLLRSLSITVAHSQSMMQLFLSAWSVIVDLCSITVDTLFCSLVDRLVVMFSTSFLCSTSCVQRVPNVLPVSPICVWLQLLQGTWYTQSVFLLSPTLSFGCTSIL